MSGKLQFLTFHGKVGKPNEKSNEKIPNQFKCNAQQNLGQTPIRIWDIITAVYKTGETAIALQVNLYYSCRA